MSKTAEEISFQIATKLAPPGSLATRLGTTLRAFWMATADEVVRIYDRVTVLMLNAFPSTVDEMLSDWEAEYALPDPCVTLEQSDDDRRAALSAKATATGGQTFAYFQSVAESLGLDVTITQNSPFLIGRSGMGDPIGGTSVVFTWNVEVVIATAVQKEMLECIFNRIKPGHTEVVFTYLTLI